MTGLSFFIDGHRPFRGYNASRTFIAVHNNWMASHDAKVYRFREHLFWKHDADGYYTATDRLYMTYKNTIFNGNMTEIVHLEKMALKTALSLSMSLNRTLILPRFHIDDPEFPIGSLYYLYSVSEFDGSFRNKYRENSFFNNPLVPNSVYESRTPVYAILPPNNTYPLVLSSRIRIRKPRDPLLGATESEILDWLGSMQESIFRFECLYGGFAGFDYVVQQQEFDYLFHKATRPCDMLQTAHCWPLPWKTELSGACQWCVRL